jgi:phenolic acid decarboxylase
MGLDTIVNKHLKYTYDNGWRYEFWLKSEKRIVYGEL